MASTQTATYTDGEAPWDLAIHRFFSLYVDNNSKPMVFCHDPNGKVKSLSDGTPNLTQEEVKIGWDVTVALYRLFKEALAEPSKPAQATEGAEETTKVDSTPSYPISGFPSVAEYFNALCQFYESSTGPISDHDAFKNLENLNAVLSMFEYELADDEEAGELTMDEVLQEQFENRRIELHERVRRSIHTVIKSVHEASNKDTALESILSLQDATFFTDSMIMEALAHTYLACRKWCTKAKEDPQEGVSIVESMLFTDAVLGDYPELVGRLNSWVLSLHK